MKLFTLGLTYFYLKIWLKICQYKEIMFFIVISFYVKSTACTVLNSESTVNLSFWHLTWLQLSHNPSRYIIHSLIMSRLDYLVYSGPSTLYATNVGWLELLWTKSWFATKLLWVLPFVYRTVDATSGVYI